ncbi:MAG: WYL domain-containing protein, partial [Proteobacteria bacterium]|nr:WYL domain-containing protein [Pseudomonadota bacterium]
KKNKNAFLYRLADAPPSLLDLYPAIRLFAEISPLGLLGYYLLDRINIQTDNTHSPQIFTFKNRYLNHILDSQVLETLFEAIHTQQAVQVYIAARLDLHTQSLIPPNYTIEKYAKDAYRTALVLPFKLYVSVMTGARYLMGIYPNSQELACIRIEHIEHAEIKADENALDHNALYTRFQQLTRNIWGVSSKNQSPTHVEMTITDDMPNGYMLTRLKNECRCGAVEQLSDTSARFSADICDARELFPWMRTFVGYISDVSFSDATLQELFIAQINELSDKYEI